LYPAGVVVESTIRVWAISRWMVATELTEVFLQCSYGHLPIPPPGAPLMFRMEEVRGPRGIGVRVLLAHFTNPFDAFHLLGRVFWCGCECIAFTTYNIFSNFDYIFPTPYHMHTLHYFVDKGHAAAGGGQQAAARSGQQRPAGVKGVARVKMVLTGPSVLCWPV
jgi:hypothetical protein